MIKHWFKIKFSCPTNLGVYTEGRMMHCGWVLAGRVGTVKEHGPGLSVSCLVRYS